MFQTPAVPVLCSIIILGIPSLQNVVLDNLLRSLVFKVMETVGICILRGITDVMR